MVTFSTPSRKSFTNACGLLPYFPETSLHVGLAPTAQGFNPWVLTRARTAGLPGLAHGTWAFLMARRGSL